MKAQEMFEKLEFELTLNDEVVQYERSIWVIRHQPHLEEVEGYDFIEFYNDVECVQCLSVINGKSEPLYLTSYEIDAIKHQIEELGWK